MVIVAEDLARHAVTAAAVTTIRDGDPEISQRPLELVERWCHGRNKARVQRAVQRKGMNLDTQTKSFCTALPWSVTGTGRSPSMRFLAGFTPRVARMVAKRSGTT